MSNMTEANEMGKNSFVLYYDWLPYFEMLPLEGRGALITMLFNYVVYGEQPELGSGIVDGGYTPSALEMAFVFFKRALDGDVEKWKNNRSKRIEAGKKGAQERWGKDSKK